MSKGTWAAQYLDWQQRYAIGEENWRRLGEFADLIEHARLNVTALSGRDLWEKGILDSLSVLSVVGDWQRAVDIGSGGGFPGLVLAIARPRRRMDLVEARMRRAEFLEQCVSRLHLSEVRVFNERAERVLGIQGWGREQYDLVTVRAVGNFRMTAELGLPAARIGGLVVGLRGVRASQEAEAEGAWVSRLGGRIARVLAVRLPSLESVRHLVVLEKVSPTPPRWPRVRHLGE